MRNACAAVDYPGTCPFCGTEVDQYEDSSEIDHLCPLCLTDLSAPDRGPLVQPDRGRSRRRWARRSA